MIVLKKAYRVKKNSEYQDILRTGKSFANRQLVIYYKEKPSQEHFRIGISVGKKIGNAVIRNKIKRHVRQAILELENDIIDQMDLVIIARNPTVHMNTVEMKKSLTHLLRKKRLFTHRM